MKPETKITNELSSTNLVICPVCNRPPSWREGGKIVSSPMVRITMSNLDALIHNGCLHRLYTDINGQIGIARRRKLIFGFLPACGKFLSGCYNLVRLLLKRGFDEGLAEFRIQQAIKKDVHDFFGRPVKVRKGGTIEVPKRTFPTAKFKNGSQITEMSSDAKRFRSKGGVAIVEDLEGGVSFISGD